MRLGTEDPLQGLQMLSVRDSSPWSPFLKAEEPQWLRHDTVVWTHTVDAECDSAPRPLPLPQGLSGAQGSPGGGQLRLAPCSPVDQAPTPWGGTWRCWPGAGPSGAGALAAPRAGPCWGVTPGTLGVQGIFIYFGCSVLTISLFFISDLVVVRVPSTSYPRLPSPLGDLRTSFRASQGRRRGCGMGRDGLGAFTPCAVLQGTGALALPASSPATDVPARPSLC